MQVTSDFVDIFITTGKKKPLLVCVQQVIETLEDEIKKLKEEIIR